MILVGLFCIWQKLLFSHLKGRQADVAFSECNPALWYGFKLGTVNWWWGNDVLSTENGPSCILLYYVSNKQKRNIEFVFEVKCRSLTRRGITENI